MGWWSSLFSSSSQSHSRALDTTDDAFSLPIASSPTLLSPQPEFTYPPTYASIETNSAKPVLPTHHDPSHSSRPGYKPPAKTWNRIRAWLHREYPELGDTLNYGIAPHDLAEIEVQFGFSLPSAVRESYLAVDGQEPESSAGCSDGLFFGLSLLPLEDVLQEWRFWRAVDDDPTTGANAQLKELMQSIPPCWIRREYSQRGWIPLIADKTGNYIGVDLNPDTQGQVGQVIVFGRDFDSKVVLWPGEGPDGWANWLAAFADDLVNGEGFELGASGEVSSGSEDDVGYESYYYDGMGREGAGEPGVGGGLKMTGEYRGWNVLEAFADRSVKRWYEAGVISEKSLPEEDKNKSNKMDLPSQFLSSAEVAIPVLQGDLDEEPQRHLPEPSMDAIPETPTSSTALTKPEHRSEPVRLPSISVTKPPAPLPVELPTPLDITAPSGSDSPPNSFDDGDLESGMREANLDSGLVSRPQKRSRNTHPLEQADEDITATSPAEKPALPNKEKEEIPDLLTGVDKDQPLVDTTEPAEISPSLEPTKEKEELSDAPTVRLVTQTTPKDDQDSSNLATDDSQKSIP